MAIDVGSACINRVSEGGIQYTPVERTNPANADGAIDTVCVWMYTDGSSMEYAAFTDEGSNVYSTNGDTNGSNLSASSGSAVTHTAAGNDFTAFAISAGDFIGLYGSGNINFATSGGSGYMYKVGDYIPCTSETFNVDDADGLVSLYGTGVAAGGETYVRNLLSSISLKDSNKKLMTFKRPFLETIDLIETIKRSIIFKRPVYAAIGLADSGKRSFNFNRRLFDSETINDSNKRAFSLKRFIYDVVNIAASVKSQLTAIGLQLLKIMLDVINITGSNKSKISTAIKQILLDAIDITDSLKSKISTALKKILLESISIIENLTRKTTFLKMLYGLLGIDASLKRKITFKRIVLSTISLISIPFRKITYKRIILSGIDLKETLFSKKTILRIIQESLNIVDSVLHKIAAIPAAVVFYKIYQFLYDTVFHKLKVDRTIRQFEKDDDITKIKKG